MVFIGFDFEVCIFIKMFLF